MTATMEIETREIRTGDDLRALRADTAFHEGALAVLTYPTADPVGAIGYDNPKAAFGHLVRPAGPEQGTMPVPTAFGEVQKIIRGSGHPGTLVKKGPAGDFETELLS